MNIQKSIQECVVVFNDYVYICGQVASRLFNELWNRETEFAEKMQITVHESVQRAL